MRTLQMTSSQVHQQSMHTVSSYILSMKKMGYLSLSFAILESLQNNSLRLAVDALVEIQRFLQESSDGLG